MDTKGKMMITCKEATFLISKKQQDKLNWFERLQLNLHLMMCKYCRRFAEQVSFITKAIASLKKKVMNQSAGVSLSDEKKQLIKKKLLEQKK